MHTTEMMRWPVALCALGFLAITAAAETGTTNIITGGASVNGGATYYIGSNGSLNYLEINNGSLTDGNAIIGNTAAASNNTAVVTGANSVWTNTGLNFYVGYTGAVNSLTVSNGGRVYSYQGYVGYNASSINNSVLVTGTCSLWNSSYKLWVGEAGSGNSLVIAGGGQVVNSSDGRVGGETSSSNNSVCVTDAGSVWRNGGAVIIGYPGANNSLIISNGGLVTSDQGYVGFWASSSNNSVLVTGANSTFSNRYGVVFGYYGGGNHMVISNGGHVINGGADYEHVGYYSSNNTVLVTGAGSLWDTGRGLDIGYYSASSNMVIIDGGTVAATNVFIGDDATANNNFLRVDSGRLVVTNAAGGAVLFVSAPGTRFVSDGGGMGELILNGGTVIVDSLIATNGANSAVTFNGGTLNTKRTIISNGLAFTIGNGTSLATLNFVGGTHRFANGLVVSSNGFLTGNGTINGTTTNFGTISPGNSPGTLTFMGNLVLTPSSVLDIQLGGTNQGVDYDFIRVTNGVFTLDRQLNIEFINGFQNNVNASEIFTFLTADSVAGAFSSVRVDTTGGFGSFLLSQQGNSFVLSDFQSIPEPSLTSLFGVSALVLLCRRAKNRQDR